VLGVEERPAISQAHAFRLPRGGPETKDETVADNSAPPDQGLAPYAGSASHSHPS